MSVMSQPVGNELVSEEDSLPNQLGAPAPVPLASRCGHLAVVCGGGHLPVLILSDPHHVLSSETPRALLPFKFHALEESQHSARSRAWKANCECGSIFVPAPISNPFLIPRLCLQNCNLCKHPVQINVTSMTYRKQQLCQSSLPSEDTLG